jgi:fatty-acid desaturase
MFSSILVRGRTFLSSIRWSLFLWITIIHCIAIAALVAAVWSFTWLGFILAVCLYYYTGFGITVGYHRRFTHKAFDAHPIVDCVLLHGATCALQGKAAEWISTHRIHHQFSDKEGDTHSPVHGFMDERYGPLNGFLWSHMGWLFYRKDKRRMHEMQKRYVKDIEKNRIARFFTRTYLAWPALLIIGIWLLGYALHSHMYGVKLVVMSVFVRTVWVWHITWMINSIGHLRGYRNFKTSDDSRNIFWPLSFLGLGEGWHNNHHHEQIAANHGFFWWETDPSFWVIKCLEKLGLVWNVNEFIPSEKPDAKAA